jgi:hypothetical protein
VEGKLVETRPYYSVRTGKHPTGGRLDLDGLKHLFLSIFEQFWDSGHFQQVLGFECVDAGFVAGSAGPDTEAFFFRNLKKKDLWPIAGRLERYTEDDLFDVIELLHDCASKGVDGTFHSYAACGWHYQTFTREEGRNEFRVVINDALRAYEAGYQISPRGEILSVPPKGLADLERAEAPPGDPDNISARVTAAVDKFRRRGASAGERRDAVRDLADVLEYLRPKAKQVLESQDEKELFDLANNFGIRHHNQRQKTLYDRPIWHSWMFYYYLATIHAVTRLIAKDESGAGDKRSRRPPGKRT